MRKRWLKRVGWAVAIAYLGFVALSTEALDHFNQIHQNQSYSYGFSFSTKYASELGVDPAQTLEAGLKDLHPQQVRLMSYWDQLEPQPGQFDFSQLDWQFNLAKQYNAKVSLAIGLRQPRYPECHFPSWVSRDKQFEDIDQFLAAVVMHYRNNPQLKDYQLENEALLTAFGRCPDFTHGQLQHEYELVKNLDRSRPIDMNVSNEYGLPLDAPRGQETGFSVYRRVYDQTITHHFVNYPFPALWFRLRAALIERYLNSQVFIHELQAEPWGKVGTEHLSRADQDKAFDVNRIYETDQFARATGIKRIDFWGEEWWYYRKTHFGDDSVWNAAKAVFNRPK